MPSWQAPTPRDATGAVDGQHARVDALPLQAQPMRSGASSAQLMVGPPPPPPEPAPPSGEPLVQPVAEQRPAVLQPTANKDAHTSAR
jgi:hypothetical protein